MDYKLILLIVVVLFIGANLFCSCCRYPIFDFITGAVLKEGIDGKDVGTPGSTASVKKAEGDKNEVIVKQRPIPAVVSALTPAPQQATAEPFVSGTFTKGIDVLTGSGGGGGSGGSGSGPAARDENIPVTERMSLMGSDINEVQNGDVAGMWVSKANTYASEFGYGIMNNTGSAYTADEPLKNGEMVIFAKNKFKPECCPAPYSSSTGCVCMTPEQIKFLNTRGGNRTSDSGV
jgi:hypothetical protein